VVLDLVAEGIPRLELFAAFAGFVVAFTWALGGRLNRRRSAREFIVGDCVKE